MKKASLKLLSLFIAIMMATVLLPVQIAKASVLSDGKFYFETTGSNATITGLVDGTTTGILVIPVAISDGANEYNVTSIGDFAFSSCSVFVAE